MGRFMFLSGQQSSGFRFFAAACNFLLFKESVLEHSDLNIA